MNNQRGISSIIVISIVVVVGAGVLAVVNRNVLKSYFQTGDKPTQEQVATLDDVSGANNVPPSPNSTVGDMPAQSQFGNTIDSDVSAKAATPTPTPAPLMNEAPKSSQKIASVEAEKSVTFRWTALVPKPQAAVTYRLKVWQLMQGQNGTQAMRSNKPIVTKDVSDATAASVSGIYTGPCRPPYLCEFVWSVSTVSNGELAHTSQPSTFTVVESAISTEVKADTHTDVQMNHTDGSMR